MWYIGECLAEPEPCHSRAGIRNTVQESITRARLPQAEEAFDATT